MINKVVPDAPAALAGLADGMTLMLGGFGLCGIPETPLLSCCAWACAS